MGNSTTPNLMTARKRFSIGVNAPHSMQQSTNEIPRKSRASLRLARRPPAFAVMNVRGLANSSNKLARYRGRYFNMRSRRSIIRLAPHSAGARPLTPARAYAEFWLQLRELPPGS